MSARVAIMISGTGSNMVRLVEDMAAGGHAEPALVLSNHAQAAGLARARALGVEAAGLEGDRAAFETAADARLRAARVDLICLAGFMRVLSGGFVAAWAGRILNIHPSLLPLFPGLRTHARAITSGTAVHGCTVHEVVEALDAGRIIGQAVVPVFEDDTAEALGARVLAQEHALYPQALRRVVRGERARFLL